MQPVPTKALTPKQIEIERKAGFKGEYFLTRSEDPFCIPFTKNLNQFRKLDFDECAPRLSEKYPEFSRLVSLSLICIHHIIFKFIFLL